MMGQGAKTAGEYYITIVTHEREKLFGEIEDGAMRLNAVGEIVRDEWMKTPLIRPNTELGEFVVMPNHFHAIIVINGFSNVGADGDGVGANGDGVGAYCPKGQGAKTAQYAPTRIP